MTKKRLHSKETGFCIVLMLVAPLVVFGSGNHSQGLIIAVYNIARLSIWLLWTVNIVIFIYFALREYFQFSTQQKPKHFEMILYSLLLLTALLSALQIAYIPFLQYTEEMY